MRPPDAIDLFLKAPQASTSEGKFETPEQFYATHIKNLKEDLKLLWPIFLILAVIAGFIFWRGFRKGKSPKSD